MTDNKEEINGEINEEIETEIDEEIKKKSEIIAKKKKGSTRERMLELQDIRRQKNLEKKLLKEKEEEIKKIKEERIEYEYLEALKIKDEIDRRKIRELNDINQIRDIKKIEKDSNKLIKSASRDILKDKFIEEAKRRVMIDLFSS